MIPINLNNFNSIGKDIYVYNNFLSNEDISIIDHEIFSKGDTLWSKRNYSKRIESISIVSDKIKEIVNFPYFIKENISINRLGIGETWGVHSDNHDSLNFREKNLLLKDGDTFTLQDNNLFGLVAYFNDFEGGELRYPNQSITYKPQKGDLVIHSSENHCAHEVLEVKSNFRYSYSNAIYEKIKVPTL